MVTSVEYEAFERKCGGTQPPEAAGTARPAKPGCAVSARPWRTSCAQFATRCAGLPRSSATSERSRRILVLYVAGKLFACAHCLRQVAPCGSVGQSLARLQSLLLR